jgi:AraC family transcriptional regulator, regulatory protein of adaptative response / methylated-DNA-[protein]-cysteine methyltransferase
MTTIENTFLIASDISTPIGGMYAIASETGLFHLGFTDKNMFEFEIKALKLNNSATFASGNNKHIQKVKEELGLYFKGHLKSFSVVISPQGTPFRLLVWESLKMIPYGSTISYQKQAENLGMPNAIRAVASANALNKIAIIIPCHRVIGKNGSLTGYAGGLERKKWLLNHEKEELLLNL